MSESLTPVQALIANWKALGDFARDAGVTYGAAKQIRRRSSIPVDYWPALVSSEKGRELGLTAEHLMRMHASERAVA